MGWICLGWFGGFLVPYTETFVTCRMICDVIWKHQDLYLKRKKFCFYLKGTGSDCFAVVNCLKFYVSSLKRPYVSALA